MNTPNQTTTKHMSIRDIRDRWLLSREQEQAIEGMRDEQVVAAEILDVQPFGRYLIRLSRIA